MNHGHAAVLLLAITAVAVAAWVALPAAPAQDAAGADVGNATPPPGAGDAPPVLAGVATRSIGAPVPPTDGMAFAVRSARTGLDDSTVPVLEGCEHGWVTPSHARGYAMAEADPVLTRLRRATDALRRITDDQAVEFAHRADDDALRQDSRLARPDDAPRTPPWLPQGVPEEIEAWVREPIDLSAHDSTDARALEQARWLIPFKRRSEARRLRFEAARLSVGALREFEGHREERRRIRDLGDQCVYFCERSAWEQRRDAWIRADEERAEDARELDEIIRSIPWRVWFTTER